MSDAELATVAGRIRRPDPGVAREAQALLDGKTKPRRSLGRLEALAVLVASVRGDTRPAPLVRGGRRRGG